MSLYKMAQLSSGGAVARSDGGRSVIPNTDKPNEKNSERGGRNGDCFRYAGTTSYLLEETSINALPLGIQLPTRSLVLPGCISCWTDMNCKGVIAHEFSHILNGDMRLNLRLIGVLHGILVIGIIGYYLLRSVSHWL